IAVCLDGGVLLAQNGNGSLKVTSFPSGASVKVDGVDTGKTTPMSISLALGDHAVEGAIPNSGWNPDSRTVNIDSGNNDLTVTLLPAQLIGAKGESGEQGPKGETGAQGSKGDPGESGPKGETGAAGLKGDTGAPGDTGPTGNDGTAGVQGPSGPK